VDTKKKELNLFENGLKTMSCLMVIDDFNTESNGNMCNKRRLCLVLEFSPFLFFVFFFPLVDYIFQSLLFHNIPFLFF
jgi:hypothetical protein